MTYLTRSAFTRAVLTIVLATSPLLVLACSEDDTARTEEPSRPNDGDDESPRPDGDDDVADDDDDLSPPTSAPMDASMARVDARAEPVPSRNDASKPNPSGSDAGVNRVEDSGAGEADSATAPACSGKPGAKKGKSIEMVKVGATTRKFILHRPANLDANSAAPVVIVPHGYTQSGEEMYRITKYWELGEKEGFVTLFPDGASSSAPWNVGNPTCSSVFGLLPLGMADDQAFLDAMVESVEADQCVDREHVFVAGFSMGGYFANDTGCQSDLVRAIAPHSGGSYDLAACQGKRKPVILFHGSADQLIPFDCGKETRARWVKRNGCSDEVETQMVANGSCEYHKGCEENGQVAFCTLNDMNHGWAGGAQQQVALYPDDYPKFESSTEVSWEFFKKYAW